MFMRLNLNFMQEDLESLNLNGRISHADNVANLDYAAIAHSLPIPPEDGVLYILNADALPKQPPKGFEWNILCLGTPPPAWLDVQTKDGSCNLLYTEEQTSAESAMNDVTRVFHSYDSWERSLVAAIDENAPMERLGELSLPMVGNPMIAQTTSYEPLFYTVPSPKDTDSGIYPAYLEDVYGSHLAEGYLSVPGKAAMAFNQDQEFASLEKERWPVMFSGDTWSIISAHGLSFKSLLFNCRVRDAVVARVIIDEVAQPIRKKDHVLIQVLGACVLKALRQSRMGDTEHNIKFAETCRELVLNRHVSADRIASLMGALEWSESDSFFCAVFSEMNEGRSFRAIARVALAASARHKHRRHFLFKEHAVVITNLTKEGSDRSSAIDDIVKRTEGMDAVISFSASFDGFGNLHSFYRQAALVQQIGSKEDPDRAVYRFEDYASAYLIETCEAHALGPTLVPDSLRRLAAADELHGADDVALLRKYLDNDRNIARTTRNLFMHRNTFLYRLDKIKAVLDADLDDPGTRLSLQIALRIMEKHR